MLCRGRHSCRCVVSIDDACALLRQEDGRGRGDPRGNSCPIYLSEIIDRRLYRRAPRRYWMMGKRKEGRWGVCKRIFCDSGIFFEIQTRGRMGEFKLRLWFSLMYFFLFFFVSWKGEYIFAYTYYFQCKIYSFKNLRSCTSFCWIFYAVFPKKKENETDTHVVFVVLHRVEYFIQEFEKES